MIINIPAISIAATTFCKQRGELQGSCLINSFLRAYLAGPRWGDSANEEKVPLISFAEGSAGRQIAPSIKDIMGPISLPVNLTVRAIVVRSASKLARLNPFTQPIFR
jgi:hypothetical protein